MVNGIINECQPNRNLRNLHGSGSDFRFCLEILKHHLVWSHGHKPMHPGQHSYTFLPRRLHVANILPIYWWLWLFPSPHSRGLLGLPNFKDKTSNARHYWDRSELQILHPPLKDSQGQKHVRTTPRALRSKGPLYLLVCSFPRSGTTPSAWTESVRSKRFASWGHLLTMLRKREPDGLDGFNATDCNH